MILDQKGKLSTAQDLTSGTTTDSENVIQYSAIDYAAMTDLWLVVDCETIATGNDSDTYKFSLVMSQESTLDTNKEVVAVTVTGYADNRLATAGRRILSVNVGKQLSGMLETDGSDYDFVGLISVISAGATVSINASLSPTEPPTIHHKMVTESNVAIPEVTSEGSGE